ncbi:endonuclease/exonuclease/phosphatase family protein, partial [Candidatus Nomurabacteria bacterium]|nr:endonuclease/exonuclease/phosphatase family protein [Candidatus Nomurabacteria bacterium]
KIINYINKNQPDVIFLQEIQIDFNKSPFSQVEIIKEKISGYKYSIHSTIYPKNKQKGEEIKIPIQHGMAILSKYPIVNSFEYYLPLPENETEPRSILCFDLDINGTIHKFANIHFTNKEEIAKNQLMDFLQLMNSRNEKRIMAGDFNMFDLPQYNDLIKDYELSFNYKNYISYPKDNGTLDYIMIPKSYKFEKLEIIENISDHNGILIEIS